MKKTTEGKLYTWFNDETWEEALESHNIDGFNDIQWALMECCDNPKRVPFKIVDHNKNIVLNSADFEWDFLILRSQCQLNHFYSKFQKESLAEAIKSHSKGFKSLEDAIFDAKNESGKKGEIFEVYDHELKVVHKDKV